MHCTLHMKAIYGHGAYVNRWLSHSRYHAISRGPVISSSHWVQRQTQYCQTDLAALFESFNKNGSIKTSEDHREISSSLPDCESWWRPPSCRSIGCAQFRSTLTLVPGISSRREAAVGIYNHLQGTIDCEYQCNYLTKLQNNQILQKCWS